MQLKITEKQSGKSENVKIKFSNGSFRINGFDDYSFEIVRNKKRYALVIEPQKGFKFCIREGYPAKELDKIENEAQMIVRDLKGAGIKSKTLIFDNCYQLLKFREGK